MASELANRPQDHLMSSVVSRGFDPLLGKTLEALRGNNPVLITTHVSPDGDAIGSTLGLARALRETNHPVYVVLHDPIPSVYRFLIDSSLVLHPRQCPELDWPNCIGVSLDCSDRVRLGGVADLWASCGTTINLDHHISNPGFAQYNRIRDDLASTGELVYMAVRELGLPLSEATATCLFAAIAADSGSYRYERTSALTFRIGAELIEAGARPSLIGDAIFDTKSLQETQLLCTVLQTLQLSSTGRVAVVSMTRDMLEKTGARDEQTEGLTNHARNVEGVEVGIFAREAPDGRIRVGFRSRGHVDVNKLAGRFGGGGHPRASGCILTGILDECIHRLVEAAEEEVQSAGIS